MKRRVIVAFLASAMLFGLGVPASAAGSATIKEQYTQFQSQYQPSKWMYAKYCYEEAYWANPVVEDVDGDGKLEAVTAAWTLTVADAATGNVKWQVERTSATSRIYNNFIVKDLDGDGAKEIVIGYANGLLTVVDARSGKVKSGWPKQISSDSVRSLAADDVDGDGKQEIIVGMGGASNTLHVLNPDGSVKAGWPNTQAGSYMDGIYSNGITTGDVDGDGKPEIIMPTDNAFINAFHGNGSFLMANSNVFQLTKQDRVATAGAIPWGTVGMYEDSSEEQARKNGGWGFGLDYESMAEKGRKGTYSPNNASSVARCVDVDGDGKKEVVISILMMDRTNYFLKPGERDWTTGSKDAKYMSVAILNGDRTRFNNGSYDWTHFPTDQDGTVGGPLFYNANSTSLNVESVPVVADINNDGVNEILFNSFDGKVHCFSLNNSRKELSGWPYKLPKTSSSQYELPAEVVCMDLNGDGTKEVIFGSIVRNSSGTAAADGALYIVGSDGKLIASQALHPGIEEDGKNTINSVQSAPVVRDVDGDGKYEILVNTTKFGLCCYEVTMAKAQPQPVGQTANPTNNGLLIDGQSVAPTAYKINGSNYFKLRDLAALLNGTGAQFNVAYDNALKAVNVTVGEGYEKLSTDLQTPPSGTQRATDSKDATYINGKKAALTIYKINGSNYFQLRELASAMGTFTVGYDDATKTATITTK